MENGVTEEYVKNNWLPKQKKGSYDSYHSQNNSESSQIFNSEATRNTNITHRPQESSLFIVFGMSIGTFVIAVCKDMLISILVKLFGF